VVVYAAHGYEKSFDGLSSLVKEKPSEEPLSGQLFVFVNRQKNYFKAPYFDRSGYASPSCLVV